MPEYSAATPQESDSIDLDQITIGDIRKIQNPALRKALYDVIEERAATGHPTHTSHGMHTNHHQQMLRQTPIADKPGE